MASVELFWGILADIELGEVVADAIVGPVLFVDLQDPGVLGVVSREYTRFFALQKEGGIGSATINDAANDEHDEMSARTMTDT